MNRLAEIEAFVAVVETGTQLAAARRMNIAVSAVHRRISDLEARLGVALTYRTKRGTALTRQGDAYYQRCLRVIADLNEADAMAGGDLQAASGLIRITVPQALGIQRIAPATNRFASDNPDVQFEIDVTDRIVDLDAEQYDAAIRIDDLSDPKPNEEILFQVRYCVCASEAFWRKHGTPVTPRDLIGMPALAFRTGQGAKSWHFRDERGKLSKVPLTVRYVSNSGSYLIEAAKAGLGVALEPEFVCDEALRKGELVQVLYDYDSFRRYAKIAYPANRPPALRVQKFLEVLRSELRAFAARNT